MSEGARVRDVLRLLEAMAPMELAESWDHVGLQVGDPSGPVSRIVVALELTAGLLAKTAPAQGALYVTHHPVIFRPMDRVRLDDPTGRSVGALLGAGASAIACHTNWDKAPGGTDDSLAAVLGLEGARPLRREERPLYRVSVMVPEDHLDPVREAMADAGAGETERYRRASFSVEGESTFEALPGASPAFGEVGVFTLRSEHRLEMVAPEDVLGRVVAAMLEAHPYEEPAFGVDRLHGGRPFGGLGRVGRLAEAMPLGRFAASVRERLEAPGARVVGDPDRPVRVVASVGGSGRSLLKDAVRAGAEVMVTADIGHHDARLAEDLGIAVIDAGHRETEQPGVRSLATRLRRALRDEGFESTTLEMMTVHAPFGYQV